MSGTVLFKVQNARRLPLQAGSEFVLIWQERLSGTLIKLPHLGLPWVSKACFCELFEPTSRLPSPPFVPSCCDLTPNEGAPHSHLTPRFVASTASDVHSPFLQPATMSQHTVGIENQRPQPAGENEGGVARQEQSQSGHTSTYASGQASDGGDPTLHDVLVPGLEELDVNSPKKAMPFEKRDNDLRDHEKGPPPADEDRLFEQERAVSMQYLLDNVAEFRELTEIRKKVNKKPSVVTYANSY